MPTVELSSYSRCSTCRGTAAMLANTRVDVKVRDFFAEPMSAGEIHRLLERADIALAMLFSTRGRPYRELHLAVPRLAHADLLELECCSSSLSATPPGNELPRHANIVPPGLGAAVARKTARTRIKSAALTARNPALIRRPLLPRDDRLVIGLDRAAITELIGSRVFIGRPSRVTGSFQVLEWKRDVGVWGTRFGGGRGRYGVWPGSRTRHDRLPDFHEK